MLVGIVNITDLFQTIGAYLGIGGALISVALGALSQRNKLIIKDLQESIDAKDGLLETTKEERDRALSDKHRFEYELESANNNLEIIRQNITQGPSIEKLIVAQATQHKQTMQALAESSKSQAKIAEAMSDMASQMAVLVSNTTKGTLDDK